METSKRHRPITIISLVAEQGIILVFLFKTRHFRSCDLRDQFIFYLVLACLRLIAECFELAHGAVLVQEFFIVVQSGRLSFALFEVVEFAHLVLCDLKRTLFILHRFVSDLEDS